MIPVIMGIEGQVAIITGAASRIESLRGRSRAL